MKSFLSLFRLNIPFAALLKFLWTNLWKFLVWIFCVLLLPTYTMISVIIFLLIADMFTGIWKSYNQGEPITAQKMSLTIKKMIGFMVGIVCAYFIQHYIAMDAIKVMLIFTGIISVTEFKSIVENIEVITGVEIWSYIINQLTELLPRKKG